MEHNNYHQSHTKFCQSHSSHYSIPTRKRARSIQSIIKSNSRFRISCIYAQFNPMRIQATFKNLYMWSDFSMHLPKIGRQNRKWSLNSNGPTLDTQISGFVPAYSTKMEFMSIISALYVEWLHARSVIIKFS